MYITITHIITIENIINLLRHKCMRALARLSCSAGRAVSQGGKQDHVQTGYKDRRQDEEEGRKKKMSG